MYFFEGSLSLVKYVSAIRVSNYKEAAAEGCCSYMGILRMAGLASLKRIYAGALKLLLKGTGKFEVQ